MVSSEKEYQELLKRHIKEEKKVLRRDINKILLWSKANRFGFRLLRVV